MTDPLMLIINVFTLLLVLILVIKVFIGDKDTTAAVSRMVNMEDEIKRLRERLHGVSHDMLDIMTKSEIARARQLGLGEKPDKG